MTINTDTAQHDWVIDGLLERGERLILTGYEGIGKSSLLFQIAACAAAGLHPFTGAQAEARRVLLVDCEHNERHVRRALERAAGTDAPPPTEMLRVAFRPLGLDLFKDDERRWLTETAVEFKADLLIVGPLYRLAPADLSDEWVARPVVRALDEVRVETDCAVIVEAHAGRVVEGGRRSLCPPGSSLFLRWPDYGIGMSPLDAQATAVELCHWRGPREERAWPAAVKHNPNSNGRTWIAATKTEEN